MEHWEIFGKGVFKSLAGDWGDFNSDCACVVVYTHSFPGA